MVMDFRITNREVMETVKIAAISLGVFLIILPIRESIPNIFPNINSQLLGGIILAVALFIFKK